MKKKLSFVIPVYNEEKNISLLHGKLLEIISLYQQQYEIEIIFVDDGSTDNSWWLISTFFQVSNVVKGIKFTRNFGHQIALTAGYDYATGDAVITLDADMQHPPQVVLQMISEWEKGFLVVYARRKKTHEGLLKSVTSQLYVSCFNYISGFSFPQGVADFRLLDRKVVTTLCLSRERFRYLRGAVFLLGYPAAFVDYDQPVRQEGVSKYSIRKMLSLAFNGLLCFSTFPLRLACYLGFLALFAGFFGMTYILFKTYFLGQAFFLYGACFSVVYMLLGMIFIVVWILGEYIFRIYELQKGNPSYVVFQKLGLKDLVS